MPEHSTLRIRFIDAKTGELPAIAEGSTKLGRTVLELREDDWRQGGARSAGGNLTQLPPSAERLQSWLSGQD